MCTGHVNGEILMWTPNMASISRCGKYMASTGKDARFKIWDIRKTFKPIHDYFTPTPATSVEFSDSGLISLSFGHEVQVWKNSFGVK
jgi:U3 small nucleolar RNA-associated protein 7